MVSPKRMKSLLAIAVTPPLWLTCSRYCKCGMGKSKDATVVVDRGMSNPENLASIRDAGYHWLVAAPQPERICYFEQFEEQKDWGEIVREPSPRNEDQQKS